ncbi:hypothetical protein [Streptomyces chromofuscus]|uniref:Uncharacterized protein n=1 Tax=Streptomyces chromofuscus TaxID=42881 RepID=A0A7M2TCU5_STRCW|nr:hypothetical protein [Streptomyces chromofuscus]QOV46520.1 hypothetical protein IPT68_11815 [Streptomyces chromofuscus]GGT07432.1 hypothetical protein GCM10010254_29750 [Streptomyces chromofuscus]
MSFFDLDQAPSRLQWTARLLPLHHLDTALPDTLTPHHGIALSTAPSAAPATCAVRPRHSRSGCSAGTPHERHRPSPTA